MNEPQMKIVATAADLHLELHWNDGKIDMIVEDTANDLLHPRPRELRQTITTAQASAIIALFVDGGENMGNIQDGLYEIAEEVLKDVPNNLRPIP